MFIPAYNILDHCKQVHGLHNDGERAGELREHAISVAEKVKVVDLFKINLNLGDAKDDGSVGDY